MAVGGAAVAFQTDTVDAPDMPETTMSESDSAESWAPSLGYGVRLGPASNRSPYVAARVEGFAVTEKERGGGSLAGAGYVGVQLGALLGEIGLAIGALGLGSFEGDSDVVPAVGGGIHLGFATGERLRVHVLRLDATFPILPANTELGAGFFFGLGLEWTPADVKPPERDLVD